MNANKSRELSREKKSERERKDEMGPKGARVITEKGNGGSRGKKASITMIIIRCICYHIIPYPGIINYII